MFDTVAPTVPTPGEIPVTDGNGLIVRLDADDVVKLTLPVVFPATLTEDVIGELSTSEPGIVKPIVRAGPGGLTTEVACTVTGPPLPGGGVIVTVTLAAGIVPAGNPVPFTVTAMPGYPDEGVVAESRTT
jgi:hypothetical protein